MKIADQEVEEGHEETDDGDWQASQVVRFFSRTCEEEKEDYCSKMTRMGGEDKVLEEMTSTAGRNLEGDIMALYHR